MIDRNDSPRCAKRRRYWATAILIAITLLGAQATSWAAGAGEGAAAPADRAERVAAAPKQAAPLPRQPSMDESYAAREINAKDLDTFKGGDVVIVGASGLVIVLLVVLILVIL